MYRLQIFTVLVAIGLSSQTVLRTTKLTTFAIEECPAKVPVISTACNLYMIQRGTGVSTCIQKAADDIVTKVLTEKDKDKIKEVICDGLVAEDQCLDAFKVIANTLYLITNDVIDVIFPILNRLDVPRMI